MTTQKTVKKSDIQIKKIQFRLAKRGTTYLICLGGKHYEVRERKYKQYLHNKAAPCDGACGWTNMVDVYTMRDEDNHFRRPIEDEILAQLGLLPRVPSGHVVYCYPNTIYPAGTPITPELAHKFKTGGRLYRDGQKFVHERCYANQESGPQFRHHRNEYLVVHGKAKVVHSRSWESGQLVYRPPQNDDDDY